MTPQAPCILFDRASFLLLCGLNGILAFQGGCAIVGSSTGSNNATVSGGVAQVCIGCSSIPPETITQLKAQGITEAALNQFFNDLGRKKILPESLDHELREIAKNYLDLKTKIAALSSEDPEVTALIQQARQAVEAVNFPLAERLFNEASQRDEQAAQHLQQVATVRLSSAAATQAANGDLHMVQLNFVKAQTYYQKALQLLPSSDREHRGQYLNSLGNSLQEAGIRTKGADIQKFLSESVTAYRAALTVHTKDQLPQDWAMTQNNLGNVLRNQGIRTGSEAGKELIRQAINAFDLALQIRTRDALPVQWEETMGNLEIAKEALKEMN
jgi:tetratricopeptide (TPR) repeat protein